MSRELVYRATCDRCAQTSIFPVDSPVESELHLDVVLQLGERKVLLDLCDAHHADLFAALDVWLDAGCAPEHQPKNKPKKSTHPLPAQLDVDQLRCGQPGCDFVGKTKQHRGIHRRRKHGIVGDWRNGKTV